MIKYQNNLISTIDSFKRLPHSILLIGDSGAGHEDVCEYISSKFNLDMHNITEFISLEYIDEINSSSSSSLYIIDMNKIDERKQNILLKLFEEPNEYTYIVLNCEHDELVLDTIKSRSYLLKFDKLNKAQLKEFVSKDASEDVANLILNVCTTPGQIEIANYTDIRTLYDLCSKILISMKDANFQNTLSISNKINFNDEYSKFDLGLFFKVLKFTLVDSDVINKQLLCEDINKCSRFIKVMNSKKQYFENFLINMWVHSKLV